MMRIQDMPTIAYGQANKEKKENEELWFELDTTISHIETKNNIAEQNIRNKDNLAIMASAIESVCEFFGINLLDLK